MSERNDQSTCHYFVDEAGDGVIFGKNKEVRIGSVGCSTFFSLGLLEVSNPQRLRDKLETLREEIIHDDYFSSVQSIKPESKKTSLFFHATDDVPEVRERVFRLLRKEDGLRFFVVVKDKRAVLEYVKQRNETDADYRYKPTELYDLTVRRLFRDRLHKHDKYEITFAKWGGSDRILALRTQLENAQTNFEKKYQIKGTGSIGLIPSTPQNEPCLQAADYCLWAVQRLFERGQDRYVEFLGDTIRLVHDIDDTRKAPYGTYYDRRNPLSFEAVRDRL